MLPVLRENLVGASGVEYRAARGSTGHRSSQPIADACHFWPDKSTWAKVLAPDRLKPATRNSASSGTPSMTGATLPDDSRAARR